VRRTLPGLPLALGTTLTYLALIVLIPVSTLFVVSASMTWARFVEVVTAPRTLAAYRLSFGAAFIAAMGFLLFPARLIVPGGQLFLPSFVVVMLVAFIGYRYLSKVDAARLGKGNQCLRRP